MSWEVDEEYTGSKNQNKPEPPKSYSLWNKTWKYIVVGVLCFSFGISCNTCNANDLKARNSKLNAENRELKKSIKEMQAETVVVTVPVYVTESVPTTEKAAHETKSIETDIPETKAAETDERILTNPFAKQVPKQVKVSDSWKAYWIEVKKSDLVGMKPDDFMFFNDYINEKYKGESADFCVCVPDFPDLCLSFTITNSDYIKSQCEVFAGSIKKDPQGYYTIGRDCCVIYGNDPNQFEIKGYIKDEYNLPQYDDSNITHFSEFNDDMFAKINELQEYAKKLWG